MSVIGIDFGTHSASIALWYGPDRDVVEVFTDADGNRIIPTAVAFFPEEVLVGYTAFAQRHKNIPNTFDDIRSLLTNDSNSEVFVPALEKEILVEEIGSHFFKNIHHQVKQNLGKAVSDCIIAIPESVSESNKLRIVNAANKAGLTVKTFIDDSSAALLSYNFDAIDDDAIILVVDIGWSSLKASLWNSHRGLLHCIRSITTEAISGSVFVRTLSDCLSKEFTKKTGANCAESPKAMSRLSKECENIVRSLSTLTEVTIDIDSLYEGMDFSSRISRAKFEDICNGSFVILRETVEQLIRQSNLTSEVVSYLCLSGGLSNVPKVISSLKYLLPNSVIPKAQHDAQEALCVGAALCGKYLIDNVNLLCLQLSKI